MKRMIQDIQKEKIREYTNQVQNLSRTIINCTYLDYNDKNIYQQAIEDLKLEIYKSLINRSQHHKKKACIVYKLRENIGTSDSPIFVDYTYLEKINIQKETSCFIYNNGTKIPKCNIIGYCNIPEFKKIGLYDPKYKRAIFIPKYQKEFYR